jgi:DNA-binding transcriptional LysR family regulator
LNNNKSLFDGMIVFCAVVENNGFSAAARKLATTPSYVSKEIARLEHRLNARLLNRTTRKVSMTDAGRHYYERARQIVEDAQSAENQAISASSKPSGLLKISVPVSFSLSYLNNWLPEFLRAYPDIRLDIEASDRMADIVSEGFDVVVRAGRLDDSELVAKRLTSSRMMVVAAPGYLQNAGTPRHPGGGP